MNKNVARVSLCALGILVANRAALAEGHFYAGLAIGRSSVDGTAQAPSTFSFPSPPTSVSVNSLPFEGHNTSWSAFLEYAATQYVGLEAGYWDHGKFGTRLGTPEPITLGIKELYFGATLRYPLTQSIALTGSAGISRAKFDASGKILVVTIVTPTLPVLPVEPPLLGTHLPLATPKDETGGYWKVGINGRITDTLEASLSYGERSLHVENVRSVSLALLYAF